jgi:hypothetical protein
MLTWCQHVFFQSQRFDSSPFQTQNGSFLLFWLAHIKYSSPYYADVMSMIVLRISPAWTKQAHQMPYNPCTVNNVSDSDSEIVVWNSLKTADSVEFGTTLRQQGKRNWPQSNTRLCSKVIGLGANEATFFTSSTLRAVCFIHNNLRTVAELTNAQ